MIITHDDSEDNFDVTLFRQFNKNIHAMACIKDNRVKVYTLGLDKKKSDYLKKRTYTNINQAKQEILKILQGEQNEF